MSDEFLPKHITVLVNDDMIQNKDTKNTIKIDNTVNIEEKILNKIEMEAIAEQNEREKETFMACCLPFLFTLILIVITFILIITTHGME